MRAANKSMKTNASILSNNSLSDKSFDEAFQEDNFVPSDYIRERLKNVRIGDEARKLQALRSEMSALNTASSELLKHNVFMNFQQFINASKEIADIEKEVYQLSTLLSDQKNLLETFIQMTMDDKASIHTVSSTSTFASNVNPTQVLLQKMDGIAGILTSMKPTDRIILYGEMYQLDIETREAKKQKSLLILLSDRLLIGNETSPGKYALESTFALNGIAAANVKNRGSTGPSPEIKLLLFPDHRDYRCESVRAKQQWLDELEKAKRALLRESGLQRQATIRGRRKRESTPRATGLSAIPDENDEGRVSHSPEAADEETLQWLSELPAELDDCIAHRDLDQAVELIRDWKNVRGKDISADAQIVLRENQLVQILTDDVSRPGGAHGGPKAMHRARTLLASLGRGTYAVQIYLRRRSALLRAAYKDVAVSEEPLAHVRQLCALFSNAASDTINEFNAHPEHYCQILYWLSDELKVLMGKVRRHVIEVIPTMAVLARTWRIIMKTSDELTVGGAQLSFEVHNALGPAMKEALASNFAHIMHAFRLRSAEEKWRPTQVESEGSLARLMEELSDVGLRVEWAQATSTSLDLSSHIIEASRAALSLAADLVPLRGSPLGAQCDDYMLQMWNELLSMLCGMEEDSKVHTYSANYVVSQVLPLCESTYYYQDEDVLTRLLHEQYRELVKYARPEEDNRGSLIEASDEEVAHC